MNSKQQLSKKQAGSGTQLLTAGGMKQRTQGAVKDLTNEFQRQRQKAQMKKQKGNASTWSEDTLLKEKMERFKPLNNKFGKKKKKEKCNEDEIQEQEPEYKGLRNSTLSDDSGREGTSETQSSVDFDGIKNSKQIQDKNIQVLPTKASSDSVSEDNSIDYGVKNIPFYVEVQEEVERKLSESEEILKDLRKNQAKRLRISFDMDEKAETRLQNKLFDQSRKITCLLKECEQKLKQLKNHEMKCQTDEQIKDNILSVLASKLKDVTFEFKQNEKQHYVKVKDIHGEEDLVKNKKQKELDDGYFQTEMQAMQEKGMQGKYKDEEIQNLVKSINDLASIFKDLSVLVIEQGTILDRIDYNVQEAKDNVQNAVKEIQQVQERENNPRAKNCIICQVTTIVILIVVCCIKFM